MKINAILLTTFITSVFWNAAADKGGLRKCSDEGDTVTIEMAGDCSGATAGKAEDFGYALTECFGFSAKFLTWSVMEKGTASGRDLSYEYESYYGTRRSRKDKGTRNLELVTAEDVNECMATGSCSNNPDNESCGMTVESFTVK